MTDEFDTRLRRVLSRVIPGFQRLETAERLSGGASQETYRLALATSDGPLALAMRRAPGGGKSEPAPAHPGLATEALLMRCARQAGVPEPEVLYVLEDEDGLGDGFIMEWLDGETLGARINRSPGLAGARAGLAHECGRILARIHAIDLQATGLAERLDTIAPATFVEQTWERYRTLETPQPMIDYAARWLMDHVPRDAEMKLVHNDFRNGNFMVTPDGINAVLDWEIAHIGDPMRDLGWLCTNSWRFGNAELPVGGFGRYEDLFKGYEEVSGEAVDPERVKFWEVFGSFWWAVGCLGMAEHYRTGPDKTVERPAIGRRSSECQVDCVNLLIPGATTLVEPRAVESVVDMPRLDELLVSVRDYLRQDVMAATEGRLNFMSRVASNSLDIVLRELAVGAELRAREHARLAALLSSDDDLEALRWQLVQRLRDGTMPLAAPGLDEHLRETAINQLAVDQPKYSGFKTARAHSGGT